MGCCASTEPEVDFDGPVNFNHFHILRAIGRGAFGRVCIVKKRDTKEMYAMKYMNKVEIIRKHAVDNVLRESEILRKLEHPFLVNLWFTFQDQEDLFMVLDLMLGGDLSYHLEKEGRFSVPRVRLYTAELGMALEYLRKSKVIHRDVKPANMLLDSGGHAHLTDFNVACIVKPSTTTTSVTGTRPYMAPEVLNSGSSGYSYAVDWWSLGVSAYEMLRGQRPFSIDRNMTNMEIVSSIRHTRPSASVRWDPHTCHFLRVLLHPEHGKRLQTVEGMKAHPFFKELDWDKAWKKDITPLYIPAQNRIHCDPTHELEEMIVEPNPLHKKQHRLSRRNNKAVDESLAGELQKLYKQFPEYNRVSRKAAEERAKSGGRRSSERGSTLSEQKLDSQDQATGDRKSKRDQKLDQAQDQTTRDQKQDQTQDQTTGDKKPDKTPDRTTGDPKQDQTTEQNQKQDGATGNATGTDDQKRDSTPVSQDPETRAAGKSDQASSSDKGATQRDSSNEADIFSRQRVDSEEEEEEEKGEAHKGTDNIQRVVHIAEVHEDADTKFDEQPPSSLSSPVVTQESSRDKNAASVGEEKDAGVAAENCKQQEDKEKKTVEVEAVEMKEEKKCDERKPGSPELSLAVSQTDPVVARTDSTISRVSVQSTALLLSPEN